MAIGPWPPDGPDPAGPLGLASTPVIVLPDPVWSDLATAGALRAGRQSACARLPGDAPALGLRMLVAVTEGADIVLVEGGAGPHLRVARALGGRPLAVLPLPDRDAVETMLQGCGLDVHVPVPSLEDPERSLVASLPPSADARGDAPPRGGRPGAGVRAGGLDLDRASLQRSRRGGGGGPRGAPRGEQSPMARAARDVTYMCAISCSTRSSLARNGSLQSTVRCA